MSPRLSLLMAFGLIGAVLLVPFSRESVKPKKQSQIVPEESAASEPSTPNLVRGPEVFSLELTREHLLLPTGEMVPVLNKAYGAPPLKWADDRPWSPIVTKETDSHGNDWYVHEDGTKTITQIVYDQGDAVPATNVAYPGEEMPGEEGPDRDDGEIRY